MAINQNTKWPNRNTLYLGRSGSGKSQACKQNPEIPRSGARVLLWDLSHDHKAHHIDSKTTYANQVKEAIKSGKPFRLAFSGGDGSIEDFEWWCSVVWVALDGNCETFVVVEELSAVCSSIGKASPNAAKLLNQGRKFGMRFHGITQKPQEISKTFYDQTEIFWIGQQRGDNVKKCAKLLGLKEPEIEKLQSLEFWRLDPKLNSGVPEFVKMTYEPNNF
ncbi:MAG: hypothetical protein AAGC78_10370 [Cellvibrio sp.]|uniref:hypothetical protein n=1 Tax=Cellvibrio sp. TaxID=1965322 RepID=UPI0031B2E63E